MIFRRSLLLMLLAILLQGCAFSRGTLGDDIKSEAVAAIKKATTTKAEVLLYSEHRIGFSK